MLPGTRPGPVVSAQGQDLVVQGGGALRCMRAGSCNAAPPDLADLRHATHNSMLPDCPAFAELVGHLLLVIVDASDDNVTIDMTGLGKAYLEVTPHIDSSQYTPSIDPVCVQVAGLTKLQLR